MIRNKKTWWAVGSAVMVAALIALIAPTGSVAEDHEKPGMGTAGNHFKCYQVLDWTEFEPKKVQLKDQFGESVARTVEPRLLCNPVDKNGEGIANRDSHLVCYTIQDDPTGPTERIKEVSVKNQFGESQLWVGGSNLLCLPSDKKYEPRG